MIAAIISHMRNLVSFAVERKRDMLLIKERKNSDVVMGLRELRQNLIISRKSVVADF